MPKMLPPRTVRVGVYENEPKVFTSPEDRRPEGRVNPVGQADHLCGLIDQEDDERRDEEEG